MMRKCRGLLLLFILVFPACAHQPEVLPQLTGVERADACRHARDDSEKYCHGRAGTAYWFREKFCTDALNRARQYCD